MNTIIDTAKTYTHAGLSVIPTLADKRPACPWKVFTQRSMSDAEIETFFAGATGIGIVCGQVSGNLELLDFDDKGSAFESWFVTIPEYLAKRLVIERSPSGGYHLYYRVAIEGERSSPQPSSLTSDLGPLTSIPGNRKLALNSEGKVLIETRGEGGYVKCAPSEGYELMSGDFQHIPTISPLEHQWLIDAAEELDERGVGTQVPSARSAFREVVSGVTPWEDYNQRGNLAELLESHGWKRTKGGDNEHWERPGKDEHSTSATWNGTVFYVFSSNALGFEPNTGYNKFQVFAILECFGSFKDAARRLRAQGYGCSSGNAAQKNVTTSTDSSRAVGDEVAVAGTPNQSKSACHEVTCVPTEIYTCVPGFISELMEHTLASAPYPNVPLAFAGALTMLSHLSGRNFCSLTGLRTNVYLCALSTSGSGKDFPRKVNLDLANRLELTPTMADRFASAEGLEDSLLLRPASFYMPDEIDTVFAALRDKDSSMERIYASLLQFYTSADTVYTMRKKALQTAKFSKFDRLRARGISCPHLTLFGTAIPCYFFEALTERSLQNGLLSRCIVLDAGTRGKAGSCEKREFPQSVLEKGQALVARGGFDGVDMEHLDVIPSVPVAQIVDEESDASRRIAEIREECDRLYAKAEDETERALWTRGAEKTMKLAMLYAISDNVSLPIISVKAVDWAWKLTEALTRYTLDAAGLYVHDSVFDEMRQRIIRYLKEAGGHCQHGKLLKRMHIDVDTFRKVIETLVESEVITVVQRTASWVDYELIDK